MKDLDLESRVNARCMELILRIEALEARTGVEAAETRDRFAALLSELRTIIKAGMVDGWASLADQVGTELEHWLAQSESQLETYAGSKLEECVP